MPFTALCFVSLLIFSFNAIVQSRVLQLSSLDDHDLISDGVHDHQIQNHYSYFLNATYIASSSGPNNCDHQYGFLPCAENIPGYIFNFAVYQGLLIFGEKQIGSGSKVLFNIIGVGKIGGIIFRILMFLPNMMLMIISGISSSKKDAQSTVSLGVGIYAGMTVFSLTFQWGLCVIYGRRDLKQKKSDQASLQDSNCVPHVEDKLVILKGTGVTIDEQTSDAARIMLLSLIPYIVVQLGKMFINTRRGDHVLIPITLVVSSLSLVAYFGYQIVNPLVQQRSLDYSKYEISERKLIHGIKEFIAENKVSSSGINESASDMFDEVFQIFKQKKYEDPEEIERIMSMILKYDKIQVLKEASLITEDTTIVIDQFDKIVRKQEALDNVALFKSLFQLLLGIVILTFLGGPLMNSILQFSYAINLPSSFISFVFVPFAMNWRATLAAISPASQKSEKSASLTFSEIYGGVIMNNIAGMTTLLAIVQAKDLTWDFSAEVLTILFVCTIIGLLAYSCTTYRLWTCLLAFSLYPFSLGLFYIIQVFLHWN